MSKDKKQQDKTAKKEQLSTKEIKELMGVGRATYKRHKGAIRQK